MEFQLSYLKILKNEAVKVLHSICQQIWKTQQWPQYWKRSLFIPIPKKGNAKECSNYHTIALISHASKVMLKILQARLQQYVNRELPDVQVGLGKQRNQRSHCQHLLDHRKGKKNIYICFTNSAKTFDCESHYVENSSTDGNTRPPYQSPEKPVCMSRSNN